MKNTVKKILALAFVVVMVCSLAVPAFAAETFDVNIIVVDNDTKTDDIEVTASKLTDGVTLKKALEKVESKTLDFVFKSGKLVEVNGIKTGVKYFETDGWYVTVNGKLITEDLSTVTLAKNDVVVVYWSDVVLNTKVAKVKTDAISTGIVYFYYIDANGAEQPLTGATLTIDGVDNVLADNGDDVTYEFVTDEKGQIWIAPEYLDHEATYTITNVDIADAKTSLKDTDDNYKKELEYFDAYGSLNIVTVLVDDQPITVKADMYNTAGATGDMTMVYVLVAAAAVVTLAAVVVMKKKSVKAN